MTDIDVNYDNAMVIEVEVPAVVPVVVDPEGIPGDPGEQGNDGWSAVLANVQDGNRRVQQVVNWIGGTGTPPAVGKYVGGGGFVDNIADATDMRGAQGQQGQQGADGEPGAVIIGEGVDILTGEGPPDPEEGATNQLYLDTISGDIYKKLDPGGWTVVANIRGPAGPAGQDGEQGEDGEQGLPGTAGWTMVVSIANDGNRRVLKLEDWIGGAGTKPGFIGQYVSGTGFTNIIANASDIRGPAGADGVDGLPGLPGVAGSSVLAGAGVPSNGLGNNGDVYIRTSNGDFYGPKVGGAWGAPVANLTGPQGLQGIQGIQGVPGNDGDDGADGSSIRAGNGAPSDGFGEDGDIYLNRLNGDLYGPKVAGAWGPVSGNIRGPQGVPGEDGTDGVDGAPGTDGTDGAAGAPGSQILTGSGAPDNSLGVENDFYIDTVTGNYYKKGASVWGASLGNLKGPQGIPGTDGTDGEDGAPGTPGAAGADGADGTNFLSGAGAPSNGLGADGDTYVNVSNGDLYKKAAGSWGSVIGNVKGPQGDPGAAGADGTDGEDGAPGAPGTDGVDGSRFLAGSGNPTSGDGEDGDWWLNYTSGALYGPKNAGAWGASVGSLKGPKGDDGADGAPGADGDDGAPGTPGASVLSGAGAPGGGVGSNGDSYLNTTNGDVYGPKTGGSWGSPTGNIKGATGAAGSAGAAGATIRTGTVVPGGGTGNGGDFYLRTSTGDWYGPKTAGSWGSPIANFTGPAGADAGDPLHYFRANKTTAQNGVTVSAPVFISWDTEDDPNSNFDLATGRWTPTAGGPVMLVGSIQVQGASSANFNAGTNITVGFRKNGSTVVGVVNTRVQAASAIMSAMAVFMDTPTAGDYYEMYVQTGAVSTGTTYNIQNSTGTFFCGVELTGSKGATGAAGANGQGVPTGGTTGQVLAKINSTDYNTQWVTPSGGSAATGFKATLATNQPVSSGTTYAFATEVYDDGNKFNNSTYQWTPPAGHIIISGRYTTSAGATSMALYKNNSLLHQSPTQSFCFTDLANGTDVYDIRATGSATVTAGINATWVSGIALG